ncbi:ribonuclease HII [Staphylococcus auricularis]|uniref:Ribonuclease HII n=1 Tax=Staphylococcus auricularis TaxID=29379 RepID=A0ABX5IIV0_9STAP|nr:ribonuclease HII [Staphylococcus auricularis]MCE5037893.1 ribonuclease HII [Staphylococcus auricularis]MEB6569586.1 ribonuclease HII [Staphylococcus auricularis]PTH19888.1 ribonuclease HII [Staphylococcus auricularis]PTH27646.1 ribonuclease HII [Staphylococcus auricularis]
MNLTITQIKEALATIDTIETLEQSPFNNDSRKGVQQALRSRRKQIERDLQLKQQYETMSQLENKIYQQDPSALICGIDEVGRGPLAGPVVACAVILNPDHAYIGINDSKQLNHKKRAVLQQQLEAGLIDFAIGSASVEEIDQYNIYQATKIAMMRAINQLSPQPTHLLIDAMQLDVAIPQQSIIKGDSKSVAIAAASILAKEYRDQYMTTLDEQYPGYDFAQNVGYGTKKHLEGIDKFGVTPVHRKSFEPIKSMIK